MTVGQGTITEALRYSWALFRTSWRSISGALALNGLAYTVFSAGASAWNMQVLFAGWVASVFTTALMYGAVYRVAFAKQHAGDPSFAPAHHGVQWSRPETRLVLTSLLVGVFTTFMALLGLLVWIAVVAGVLMSKGVAADQAMTQAQLMNKLGAGPFLVACLALVALACLMVFISTRLSLAWAATVNEGGVRVLRTWKLTRGRFWQVFAAILITWLPFVFLVGPIADAILSAGGAPTDVQAGFAALKAGTQPPTASADSILVAALLNGGLQGFMQAPLGAGVAAYFYLVATGAAPTPAPPAART